MLAQFTRPRRERRVQYGMCVFERKKNDRLIVFAAGGADAWIMEYK